MKNWRASFIFIFTGLISTIVLAKTVDEIQVPLTLTEKESRGTLSLGLHQTTFSINNEQFSALGPRGAYKYKIYDHWALHSHVLMTLEQKGSNTMTAFGLMGTYDVFHEPIKMNTQVSLSGQDFLSIQQKKSWQLEVGLGLNQYYFNGTKGVYALSGPCAQLMLYFSAFDLRFHLGAQSSSVVLNEKASIVQTLMLGLSF